MELQTIMAIYEVTYSTKTASNEELSYSDVVLVEVETLEALTTKVVDLMRKLVRVDEFGMDELLGFLS
jgi:hypothetical protein